MTILRATLAAFASAGLSCDVQPAAAAPMAATATSTTERIEAVVIVLLLDFQFEYLLRVVFEDEFLVRVAQPVEVFDDVARLVEPPIRPRILHRAHPRPLRSEHAAIGADRLDEEREGILRIEHRIVIDVAQPL